MDSIMLGHDWNTKCAKYCTLMKKLYLRQMNTDRNCMLDGSIPVGLLSDHFWRPYFTTSSLICNICFNLGSTEMSWNNFYETTDCWSQQNVNWNWVFLFVVFFFFFFFFLNPSQRKSKLVQIKSQINRKKMCFCSFSHHWHRHHCVTTLCLWKWRTPGHN